MSLTVTLTGYRFSVYTRAARMALAHWTGAMTGSATARATKPALPGEWTRREL